MLNIYSRVSGIRVSGKNIQLEEMLLNKRQVIAG